MIVRGGTIVTLDKKRRVIEDGAVVIKGNRIEFVGGRKEVLMKYGTEDEVNARGRIIFPGFINAHTHMFQVLLRCLAVDLPLLEWLKRGVWPMMVKFREDDIYVAALLGCVENIKSGVTCVVDNHYVRYFDAVARAMIETGIRGCIARGFYETGVPKELRESPENILSSCESLIRRWNGAADGRIMIGIAPMVACFASRELLAKSKDLSDKYGVIYHMHTSETRGDLELTRKLHGKTDVKLLEELGILGPRFHSVHSVWVSKEEIGCLAQSGSHVVHNPVSNMYLGSGIAPIPEMMAAGINVALGTDGPASNNNQDIIQSMKFAACLHKVSSLDPAAITAQDVLEMATINGAKALGLEREIGSIEEGKRADLTIVNMQKSHIAPVHDPIASLVYCANCGDVDAVIIDGKLAMENGEIKTINEREILRKADETVRRLKEHV